MNELIEIQERSDEPINIVERAIYKGEPGFTPYIGANGNWWINGADTGYPSSSGTGGSSAIDSIQKNGTPIPIVNKTVNIVVPTLPADINAAPAMVADQNYITNAEKANLHSHANKAALDNVSGSNTGDETVTTIKSKLGITTLSGSNTGDQDLSPYALNTHNHTGVYQPAKTADELYVSTAEKTNLHSHANKAALDNVSGSNTGDETVTTIKSKLGITTLSGSNTGDETVTTIKSKLGVTTLSGSNTGDETVTTIKSKLGITTLSGSNTGDQDLSPYALTTHNHTGVYQPALGFTPENAANKQNSLAPDGTGTKLVTVDAVNAAIGDIETILASI